MFNNMQQIADGTTVYDSANEKVGTVAENHMEESYLVVEKGWLFPKDFYVPTNIIERADNEGVFLRISTEELKTAQYDDPPMTQGRTVGSTEGFVDGSAETAAGEIRVPVRAEELVVGTQVEEEGRVHVHKDVVTEQRTVQVPLRQEQVTVERVAMSGEAPAGDDVFVERDIDIPVMGEQAVVGKRVAGVEEVIIRKDVVTEQERVTDSVRKERVTVGGIDASGQATVDRTGSADRVQ